MSKCCPGGLNGEDHLDGCAFNPKNFAPAPDAAEPKSHEEQKRLNNEDMRRFAELADKFMRAKREQAT